MNPNTEGTEEQGPSRVPFVNDPAKRANKNALNDPGNEDPGWGLDDAQVPLIPEEKQD